MRGRHPASGWLSIAWAKASAMEKRHLGLVFSMLDNWVVACCLSDVICVWLSKGGHTYRGLTVSAYPVLKSQPRTMWRSQAARGDNLKAKFRLQIGKNFYLERMFSIGMRCPEKYEFLIPGVTEETYGCGIKIHGLVMGLLCTRLMVDFSN